MHILGVGTAHPPSRYARSECLVAFEKTGWFARLDGRAHLIARTVLQRDKGIDARRLALGLSDEVCAIDPDTLSRRFLAHARQPAAHAGERALVKGGLQAVQVTLLNQHDIVSPATLAAYSGLGWTVQVQVADVLTWAAQSDDVALGMLLPRCDLITTSLFLHHFDESRLERMLAAVASRTDRFFACGPRRSGIALVGSQLVGAIGANAVARQDAVSSVKAGFRDNEITTAWPRKGEAWATREFAAGASCHCFSARRRGLA